MQPNRITPQALYQNNERKFKMLKNFENWLLEQNYSVSTCLKDEPLENRISILEELKDFAEMNSLHSLTWLKILLLSCLNMKQPVKNQVMEKEVTHQLDRL